MDSRFRGNDGLKKDTEAGRASKQPAVYIMASGERGTLYVGVTGNLKLRAWEHRDGVVEGFTKHYGVKHLVWFEFHPDFPSAIAREKQLKKWNRAWKLELIEGSNPRWRDLLEDLP
ncbi:GIY-YIG nuclease family protein [Rhodanobacter denitrificans]|uniref:GIY-YIG nuclease family protein n=1 Tax=Rhodanobacter denitrificans TaxID=666685 RepID=A0A368KDQ0_9GAMM|nr:GIY-YIG nuclease family protein [Rhodanobacter denitrificans]RCS30034.1 GIY-YIG nuclease family protein [Rhodanobacter denitrificans]